MNGIKFPERTPEMSTRASSRRNRIEWIDLAKGIGILLVIAGHTAPFGSTFRNFIFSFHMPLFFLLSGYTSKRLSDRAGLVPRVKKSFFRLILPAVIILFVNTIWIFLQGDAHTAGVLAENLLRFVRQLFWASGGDRGFIIAIGSFWFLFAMFWGKIIWDLINLYVPKYRSVLCLAAGIGGILLGRFGIFLPQSLDIALVTVLFYECGQLFREHGEALFSGAQKRVLFWICLAFWMLCLFHTVYIELASRSYPGILLAVIESMAAVFVVCLFCKDMMKVPYVNRAFPFLGRYSLWILMIHRLDYRLDAIWLHGSWKTSLLLRLILDLALFAAAYAFWKYALRPALRKLRVLPAAAR